MAPDKRIMGTTVHVASDPPHEDGPPLQPPRPRMGSKPRFDDFPDHEAPTSAQTPESRKLSPPGGIKVQGKGWTVSVPAVVITAVLSAGGTLAAGRAVAPPAEKGDLAGIRDELAGLRADVRELRDDQRKDRQFARAQHTYTEQSIDLMAQTIRALGGKLNFAPGAEPEPLEFHEPPLNPGAHGAPSVQPRAVLPASPKPP
jgi:hypothetical protein